MAAASWGIRRRPLLAAALGWAAAPRSRAGDRATDRAKDRADGAAGCVLAAAWDDTGGRHYAGLLRLGGAPDVQVLDAVELPTRAHGLLPLDDGSLLVAARRPGTWLLRWHPQQAARSTHWRWSEADRRFCGHAVAQPDGTVLCTEADQADGAGLLVRRDALTLELRDEWPTHGIDPHEALRLPDGNLLVANGGVPTRPETGRTKGNLAQMDSSLVRLDAGGRLNGQWRLDDPRLSIRHLARHPSGIVGIALQAEHDDPAERAAAPCLALFDGRRLRTVAAPHALAGYGGGVLAHAEGFVVAATRADRLAQYGVNGGWRGELALPQACALASDARHRLLAAGAGHVLWQAPGVSRVAPVEAAGSAMTPIRLDNHWVVWPHPLR